MEYTILILLLPLLSFLFLGLAGMKLKPVAAGLVGTAVLGVVMLLSCCTAFEYFMAGRDAAGAFPTLIPWNTVWLPISRTLHIDMGILLDPISVMMLVVISTVSLMVHVYSLGYMKGERGFQRYYAFLSLFTMSMMGLVVATNIFQMYLFWELVGVSSYLLIGFYYTKKEAVAASKKAFIVTRFADLGFLVGILFYGYYAGTFSFTPEVRLLAAAGTMIPLALGLMFIGGAGKSAMFPLHIWLPDAMEGPTPVSALIHCRDDGRGGRLPRGAHVPALYRLCARSAPLDGLHRCLYGAVRRRGGLRPKRYQARAGVQHHFADRFYDRGAGRLHLGRSACGRAGVHGFDVPPLHARHVQGPAVPRRRMYHPRRPLQRNVGHGRPAQVYARDARHVPRRLSRHCRHLAPERFLLEGRDSDGLLRIQPRDGVADDRRRRTDGVLHVPPVLQYLLGAREPGAACRAQAA